MGDAFDDLITRARRGDEAAFVQVFRDVQPALLAFLRVRDPGSEDRTCASETWSEVARGLTRSPGTNAGLPWLGLPSPGSGPSTRLEAGPAAGVAPETVDRRPAARRVRRPGRPGRGGRTRPGVRSALLAALPQDQADVVMLRVVTGLTNAEVAQIVGKSEGAVRVIAHRALRRLAARIDAAELLGVTRMSS